MTTILRLAQPADAEAICAIYNHYISNTCISFEEVEVNIAEMSARIHEVTQQLPWLVLEEEGQIRGYAYATKWRVRPAYRHSVETSVYLAHDVRGRGWGRQLYEELLVRLRGQGLRTAIGGVALPNDASVALHEKMGYEKVAHFQQVGHKHGRWIDVGYWQKLL
jgi:phosphinothricin acetyltransferase